MCTGCAGHFCPTIFEMCQNGLVNSLNYGIYKGCCWSADRTFEELKLDKHLQRRKIARVRWSADRTFEELKLTIIANKTKRVVCWSADRTFEELKPSTLMACALIMFVGVLIEPLRN